MTAICVPCPENEVLSYRDFGPDSNPGAERRREPRYATYDAVEVSVLGLAGFQIRGVLRDVSRNGLRVEVGLPVDPGAHLKISLCDRAIIFAVACYCRRTRGSYHVGAAIRDVYHPKSGGSDSGTALPLDSDFRPAGSISSAEAGKAQEYRSLAKAIVDEHVVVVNSGRLNSDCPSFDLGCWSKKDLESQLRSA
jgi:PilZ domain